MQNGPDWGSSTQLPSTKTYNAYLIVYKLDPIKPAIIKAETSNKIAINLANNIPTKNFEIQIEKVTGYYSTDNNFLGGGTRIKCPQVISGIYANFWSDTSGIAYCEVLDENLEILKTVSTNINATTSVYFNLENLITGLDTVWIRMYGEGNVIPRRSEISTISPEMLSKENNNNYHIYKINGNWIKTTSSAYCIPFTIYGTIASKTITVGTNKMFSSIKSAIEYANSLPIYEWNIIIDEGIYDIYS